MATYLVTVISDDGMLEKIATESQKTSITKVAGVLTDGTDIDAGLFMATPAYDVNQVQQGTIDHYKSDIDANTITVDDLKTVAQFVPKFTKKIYSISYVNTSAIVSLFSETIVDRNPFGEFKIA